MLRAIQLVQQTDPLLVQIGQAACLSHISRWIPDLKAQILVFLKKKKEKTIT